MSRLTHVLKLQPCSCADWWRHHNEMQVAKDALTSPLHTPLRITSASLRFQLSLVTHHNPLRRRCIHLPPPGATHHIPRVETETATTVPGFFRCAVQPEEDYFSTDVRLMIDANPAAQRLSVSMQKVAEGDEGTNFLMHLETPHGHMGRQYVCRLTSRRAPSLAKTAA